MSDKKRVLVVDDMYAMRMMITKCFKDMDYDVVVATDGQIAWEKLSGDLDSYAIVCCDWAMPRMTGLELLKKVRADRRLANQLFIMLTSEAQIEQVKEAIANKVDGYIRKPFQPEIVKEKVEQVLAAREKLKNAA